MIKLHQHPITSTYWSTCF